MTEVLNDYFQRKNSGIWRQLKMSPEKVRTIVFGLAKPFDKRVSKVGIINPTFQSTCINKLIEKFVMTNECTVARARFSALGLFGRRAFVRARIVRLS